jgi:hypothetical protein
MVGLYTLLYNRMRNDSFLDDGRNMVGNGLRGKERLERFKTGQVVKGVVFSNLKGRNAVGISYLDVWDCGFVSYNG